MDNKQNIRGPFFKSCCQLARRFDSANGVKDVQVGEKYSSGAVTGSLSLRFNVDKKKPRSQLKSNELIPKKISGIKTDVVEHRLKPQKVIVVNPAGIIRPLFGGVKLLSTLVSRTEYGTFGCILNKDGLHFGLTNYHVLFGNLPEDQAMAFAGRTVVQPDIVPATNAIGKICTTFSREFDYALFTVVPPVNAAQSVNKVGGLISGWKMPDYNMRVIKVGVTTGLTHGIIESRSCRQISRITLRYDDNYPNDSTSISMGGDSGAVWLVAEPDGTHKVVALHNGGDSQKIAYATNFSSINSSLQNKYQL